MAPQSVGDAHLPRKPVECTAVQEYDPFSYRVQEDPYPIYRTLRDEAPAWWSEQRGFWALSRYEDVLGALKDPIRFSNRHGMILEKGFESEATAIFSILAMDPPRHDRQR